MKILFTICGRAGSKGFKNKNIRTMNGVPLVYYTIDIIKLYQKKHSENDLYVALNTDSEKLQKLIMGQKMISDIRIVPRKTEHADDWSAKVDVIQDTYFAVRKSCGVDCVIDLDITSPLRKVSDIERMIDIYTENKEFDLVVSVVNARRNPYFNMVEEKSDGFYGKVCKSNFTTRQQTPSVYELNAGIYAFRPRFLEKEIKRTILDYRCGVSVMKDYLVLDIDSEEDLKMLEFLHRYYMEEDGGLRAVYETAVYYS